jgi:2-succinyl-5-enolpyruvyl-6-hydroxy-3-cyclohexene-1-carboxylate synthase
MIPNPENMNVAWANLIIEELVRLGLNYACISPGSRSTPLTVAAARHPEMQTRICIDERGAAFHALGYARATQKPALLICTSGTAPAHYLPAVIEASQDRVPLLILSADRPPELLQCGANQAIRQQRLFGDYLRWFFDLPCPEAAIAPEMVLTTIDQAVARSTGSQAGPVQINCAYREPFAPIGGTVPPHYLDSLSHWQQSSSAYTDYTIGKAELPHETLHKLATILNPSRRGLLLVGRLSSDLERESILEFANTLGWPVFADSLSSLAQDPRLENKILHFDPLLLHPEFQVICQPDTILHIGGEMVSTRVQQHLASYHPEHYLRVAGFPDREDPLHQLTARFVSDIPSFCKGLLPLLAPDINQIWVKTLQAQAERAEEVLAQMLDNNPHLSEPAIVREVCRALPQNSALFIGNSMPIRDLDMFANKAHSKVRIFGNRGASGIDGNLACALGLAEGLACPTTLLLGDLALLHDLNALALVSVSSQPLILVVINNQGGGIFSFLPIASETDVFEPFFGTPHNWSFEKAAQMFDLDYAAPNDPEAFKAAYQGALETQSSCLIEIRTQREANYSLHEELQRAIGERLRGE